jgi:hypothetical protein
MVTDPYYWYWTSYQTTQTPPPAPSPTDLAVILLVPLALVAVCLGVALWERTAPRRRERRSLRCERRALASIELVLRRSDPDLARRLDDFDADTPSRPAPGRTESAT